MTCGDDQLHFCVHIINQLSQEFKKPTGVVYRLLSESGVLDDYVIGCYDSLHTLGRAYLVEDIVGLLGDRGVVL